MIVDPAFNAMQWKQNLVGSDIVRAKIQKKPETEIEALKKKLEEVEATALDGRKTFQGPNAHDSKMLPLILCGGKALGLKHQGHLVKTDVPVANVWQTVVDRVGMKMPENFQGGLASGIVKELV